MVQKQAIFPPLGVALVLALGFGTLIAVAVGWAITIGEMNSVNSRTFEDIVVSADGTPFIEHEVTEERSQTVYLGPTRTYRTLDGVVAEGPKDRQQLGGHALSDHGRVKENPFLVGRERILRFSDENKAPNFWYFVHERARNGRAYFVGYDGRSNRRLGFIGRNGLQADQPPVEEWFSVDGDTLFSGAFSHEIYARIYSFGYAEGDKDFPEWKIDMIAGNQILEVDLRTGSVTSLFESADLIRLGIISVATPTKNLGDEPGKYHFSSKLAARTKDRVIVFNPAGKPQATFVLPEEFRGEQLEFYELNPAEALLVVGRKNSGQGHRELIWIGAPGRILRRTSVTLQKSEDRQDDEGIVAWLTTAAVPSPIVNVIIATVGIPVNEYRDGLASSYWVALAKAMSDFALPLLALSLLSTCMAVYCYRRHVRYGQPFAGVWFAFVLLLGLPGLVGYLYHRRWPVLEKCQECGQTAPRDRESCARCSAMFPPPSLTGCEVFA